MQLSIIIVNFNVKYFLEQCLYSVIKACEGLSTEITVVDNNSSDGSRKYLEPKFTEVKFIWSKENAGFGKANNLALSLARGEYVLILNPDTIVAENSFTKCITYLEANKNCGALGVHMIDGSGLFLKESKRNFPSPLAAFTKVTRLSSLFPSSKSIAGYYATHIAENGNGKVDVLAGAFMMVRKKVLDITGGFDEDFFMYGEDIDLCYRIIKAGFENHYFSGTTIIHFKGESTQQNKVSYTKDFYNAMQLFVHKHYRQQIILSFFMKRAISSVKFISSLHINISKKTNQQQPLRTVLVASQGAFDKTLQLVKYAQPALLICGRITTHVSDNRNSIGQIADFKKIITAHKISTIIFCEENFSYQQMMEVMKENRGLHYFFHARDSMSIVGSRHSSSTGDVITSPPQA